MRILCLASLILPMWLSPAVRGETLDYDFEIGSRQGRRLTVEFVPAHAGTVSVVVAWEGGRPLAFQLLGPDGAPRAKRSGPSPQRLTAEVAPQELGLGQWTFSVRALPGSRRVDGTIRVELPGLEEVEESEAEAPAPEALPVPAAPEEPWKQPVVAPVGAGEDLVRFFDAVESFRRVVVADGVPAEPDACGWQSPTLEYLSRSRGAAATDALEVDTLRYLSRLAGAIRQVDRLRTSEDPIVVGPAPETVYGRQAWLKVREQQVILPIETELDALHDGIRRGFARQLDGERWPIRFTSCLMACERFFEQRGRLGEAKAAHRELAESQWERFLAAGQALEALVSLAGLPEQEATPTP